MSWNEAFAARYDEWAAHRTEGMVNGDDDVYVERKWRIGRVGDISNPTLP